jgi:hypothetical protein
MNDLKLSVPTYYGSARFQDGVEAALEEFDAPEVPVLIHQDAGIRIVLGTHDYEDLDKPDIQIERRPKGWAIFLHPVGGDDPSGYIYFLDNGRSFLLRDWLNWSGSIDVLAKGEAPPEIDQIDSPEPDICTTSATVAGEIFDEFSDDVSGRIHRPCERCAQLVEVSEDWYDDLCPGCADATDGGFECPRCGRRGSFEDMGGNGSSDPLCCGQLCRRACPNNGDE